MSSSRSSSAATSRFRSPSTRKFSPRTSAARESRPEGGAFARACENVQHRNLLISVFFDIYIYVSSQYPPLVPVPAACGPKPQLRPRLAGRLSARRLLATKRAARSRLERPKSREETQEGVRSRQKTAQGNGRFGPWFPLDRVADAPRLVAIARRVIGPGEIGHDGGSDLRVILQMEAETVCFIRVDARLVLTGKRPLRNIGALAHVDPGVFRLRFGERNALGEKIYGAQRLERVLAQIDAELVALPRFSGQRHRAELGHVVLRRIGYVNAKASMQGSRSVRLVASGRRTFNRADRRPPKSAEQEIDICGYGRAFTS